MRRSTSLLTSSCNSAIRLASMFVFCALVPAGFAPALAADKKEDSGKAAARVSFYRAVRPILQRSCSGCHQPAKRSGKLLLTSYEGLKAGGESGPAVIPGKPKD